MATPYTAPIDSGEITTAQEYLLRCARHVPVIRERMERSVTGFTPSEFIPFQSEYQRSLDFMRHHLEYLEAMTPEEISAENEAEYQKEVESQKWLLERAKERAQKYKEILNKVQDWNPPSISHRELKKFAIQELQLSMPDYRQFAREIGKPTDEEWIAERIKSCKESIARAEKAIAWEEQQTEKANEFLQALRESTENL